MNEKEGAPPFALLGRDDTEDEIKMWLRLNGIEGLPVYNAVCIMCDTVEELLSLQWEDIDKSTMKVGQKRLLMFKINASKASITTLDGTTGDAAISNAPPNQEVIAQPVAPKKLSPQSHVSEKVQKLITLSEGRIIFGRMDKQQELSDYERAMNQTALGLVKNDPSLLSFTGTDVLRHVKTGALQTAARDALQKSDFFFAKGNSRGHVASSLNTGAASEAASAVTKARVSKSIRQMQLAALPAKLENLRQG